MARIGVEFSGPPAESTDLVLVSRTRYNAQGEAFETVDPAGKVNRTLRDAAGRTVRTIQNYIAASACAAEGDVSPGESENVVTDMTYNADGKLLHLIARNPDTGDQTTTYAYGVTLEDSALASNDLPRSEIYPDTKDGADQVFYTYNRQGQETSKTDQNGNVHAYAYDALSRPTADSVTTLAAETDAAVQNISRAYEVRGMVQKITSHDAPAAGTIVNEVANEYNDFALLEAQYQSHAGAVDTMTTPAVGYTYADGSNNTTRPEKLIYPNGRELDYQYDDEPADKLSRIRTLRWDEKEVCQYGYLGLGTFVNVDYPEPAIQYNLATGPNNTYQGLDRFNRIVDLLWEHNTSPNSSSSSSSEDLQTPLVHLQYGYDQASNRTFRKDLVAQSNGKPFDELYTYDGLHRLKTFHRGQLTDDNRTIETPTLQQGWVLDATGNWKNFTQHNQQQPNQALDQQRLHNSVNEITNIARTVGQSWATPVYDRNGNMTEIPQPNDPTKTYKATFDAWNRLTKLEEETESGLQMVQESAYDGQMWRTVCTDYEAGELKEARHFYYNAGWQCIEERLGAFLLPDRQYIWGQRYADDLICRDRSVTDASSRSSSSSSEDDRMNERLYCLQDANWNVVAISNDTCDVQERFIYSSYGMPERLSGACNAIQASSLSWNLLFASYFQLGTLLIYTARRRNLHPLLGLWVSRDSLVYRDGLNLYQYAISRPAIATDPFGMQAVITKWQCQCITSSSGTSIMGSSSGGGSYKTLFPPVFGPTTQAAAEKAFEGTCRSESRPVVGGYISFTKTLVCTSQNPTADELRLMQMCQGDADCLRCLANLMTIVASVRSTKRRDKCYDYMEQVMKRLEFDRQKGFLDIPCSDSCKIRFIPEAWTAPRAVVTGPDPGMWGSAPVLTGHGVGKVSIQVGTLQPSVAYFDIGAYTNLGNVGGADHWFFAEDYLKVTEYGTGAVVTCTREPSYIFPEDKK